MKRSLLLLSNSTNPGEAYLGWGKDIIKDFLQPFQVKEVLFIPYAGVSLSYDEYEAKVSDVYAEFGIKVKSVHRCADPVAAVKEAACIVVGGGSTWHLLHEVQRLQLVEPIREKVSSGTPYMGWSAGSNLACPTICTTNDMPIIQPESFKALNLIPFQINPHYLDAHPQGHGGETREDRIKEFMIVNKDMYVAGLREASAFLIHDMNIQLIGRDKTLRVFKYGIETKEYEKGSDLSFLL